MYKLISGVLLLGVLTTSLSATSFTSSSAFNTALAGRPQVFEDFSGLASGTIISPGQRFDGITYTSFSSGSAVITPNYSSVSGNSLGGQNLAQSVDYFQGAISFQFPLRAQLTH